MAMNLKHLVFVILTFVVISCDTKPPANLTVNGQVKGLKKGTLYLERLEDTALVVLDSMIVNGDPQFILQTTLEEPEVLFLRLNDNTSDDERIRFFADIGSTDIHTTLKRFVYDANITGCDQQKLLEEFDDYISKFNNENLELIKEQLEVYDDSVKRNDVLKRSENLLKRKYLFAINFAVNHKDSEIAPYIALREVFDANVTYLDTIYNSLEAPIANSKYGKQLQKYISDRKLAETAVETEE